MAINLNESIPVIYSAKVMEALETDLVYGKVARKDFEGEINKGDRIIIRGYADPSVGTYSGSTISWETIKDTAIQLDITEMNYTAVKIDDVDKFQSDIEYMNRMAKKSAYVLAKTIDKALAGLYNQSAKGTYVVQDTTTDTATVIGDLTECHTAMSEADIPDSNQWIIVPPWVRDKLYLAGIAKAQNIEGGIVNNYIGRVLDMDMYYSNNVYGSKTGGHYIMFGSYDAIALVEQIKESQFFPQFEDTFGSGIRTLIVWGYEVVKPAELFYSVLTYAAETAI